MDNKKSKPLGGGVHQLNNNRLFNLQLFADTLNYSKVDNPYEFYLNKPTWAKGDIKKVYNLVNYYKNIPNYSTITTLPEENAEYIKEALPNVTSCNSMMGAFYSGSCKALTSINTVGWDTSKVINMYAMFYDCEALTTLDVSKFNTSNVIDMSYMFDDCKSLTTLDISKWDTSKVTRMASMFNDCKSLTTLDISNWDTSNVTNMSYMFYDCEALTTLDVSKWNTSKVTNMSNMFDTCTRLKTLDLSKWDTSNVTNMDSMFYNCRALTTIKGILDMKSCTSYHNMFNYCSNLTAVKIKNPPSGITATSGIGGLAAGKYEIVS